MSDETMGKDATVEPPPLVVAGAADSVHSSSVARPASTAFKLHGLAGTLGLVAAADSCLYQGTGGLSGWAAFLLVAAICLTVGIGRFIRRPLGLVLIGLLLFTAVRLAWQGNVGLIVAGVVQLAALVIVLHGQAPWIENLFFFAVRLIPKGLMELPSAVVSSTGAARLFTGERFLNYGIPVAVCGGFTALFVYANPAAIEWSAEQIELFRERLIEWLMSVRIGQLLVWVLFSVLGVGAIAPSWRTGGQTPIQGEPVLEPVATMSRWYVPSRNLLWGVIVIFSIYLTCEFATLWFREFPTGFYYSGYAHQGAAWLTVALLCTTLVLSAIFQRELLRDPRVSCLRKLAAIWSLLNGVLALAVYHRLLIYVDFNGMTMLRMVGFFGITTVVVGFSLVLWKIRAQRTFQWLIHRQLVVLALALYVLALTPVDWIVYRINTWRVLHGDLAPIVQVTEQRLSSEAWLSIWPLVDSREPVIRDGIRANFAELNVEPLLTEESGRPWQRYQYSNALVQQKLRDNREVFADYVDDSSARRAAMERLRDFAYQWY